MIPFSFPCPSSHPRHHESCQEEKEDGLGRGREDAPVPSYHVGLSERPQVLWASCKGFSGTFLCICPQFSQHAPLLQLMGILVVPSSCDGLSFSPVSGQHLELPPPSPPPLPPSPPSPPSPPLCFIQPSCRFRAEGEDGRAERRVEEEGG